MQRLAGCSSVFLSFFVDGFRAGSRLPQPLCVCVCIFKCVLVCVGGEVEAKMSISGIFLNHFATLSFEREPFTET